MDASSWSSGRSTELAALRRRAYGPDADIHGDPVALARLHELEARERPAGAGDGPAASDAPDAGSARPTSGTAARAPDVADPAIPSRLPRRRVPGWVIAFGFLLLGGGIGGAVGGAVGASLATASATPPDATLRLAAAGSVERTGDWGQVLSAWGMDASSLVPFEEYRGIEVWAGRSDDGARCVLLAVRGAPATGSCASGGLEPMLDFVVDARRDARVDTALPDGTVMRFLARSSTIDVWVRPPAGSTVDAPRS